MDHVAPDGYNVLNPNREGRGHMTPDELDSLGVTTDVVTAGRALGISRTSAYAAIHNGTFPVRTVRIGSRIVVPTAELRELLGV